MCIIFFEMYAKFLNGVSINVEYNSSNHCSQIVTFVLILYLIIFIILQVFEKTKKIFILLGEIYMI